MAGQPPVEERRPEWVGASNGRSGAVVIRPKDGSTNR